MDTVIGFGFSEVSYSIEFLPQTIKKGQALVVAGHVRNVVEKTKNGNTITDSSVIRQTSISAKAYNVKLKIDDNRQVTEVHCECVANALRKCKHIFAVIHFVNTDRSTSKTSFEKEWGMPSATQMAKAMYSKGMTVAKLFPQKKLKSAVLPAIVFRPEDLPKCHSSARDVLIEESRSEGDRLRRSAEDKSRKENAESVEEQCIETCLETLLITSELSNHFAMAENFSDEFERNHFNKFLRLEYVDVMQLSLRTRSQSSSLEWFEARRIRISASSKAHTIHKLQKKNPEALVAEYLSPKVIHSKNFDYGLENEKRAIDAYKKLYHVQIFQIGLFVSPQQPWLSASVDGVVVEEGEVTKILEVKYPISCKKLHIYDQSTGTFHVPYLNTNGDNYELDQKHQYYTQCQTQLYVTGMMICDFFVWSPISSCKVEVHRNEDFLSDLIPKLNHFHFSYYLKGHYNEEKENSHSRDERSIDII